MNTYRPNEFAKLVAKTTKTLQRWDREGILKAHRSPTNRRFYTHEQLSEILGVKENKRIAISYCRVSNPGQKDDLLSQQKAVADFCIGAGIAIDEAVNEALSPESEMVQDLMAIIHCFSCRLYGLRRYKKIIKEAVSENPNSI